MDLAEVSVTVLAAGFLTFAAGGAAWPQAPPGAPPAVGVVDAIELRERYGLQGGLEAVVIRLRLPNGRMYGKSGKLNFVDNTIAQNTDTITVRGIPA
jgi:hypothetical protein